MRHESASNQGFLSDIYPSTNAWPVANSSFTDPASSPCRLEIEYLAVRALAVLTNVRGWCDNFDALSWSLLDIDTAKHQAPPHCLPRGRSLMQGLPEAHNTC